VTGDDPTPASAPEPLTTTHRIEAADARDLDLPADSVDLVVTSPPYPMVELWDDLFAELAPAAGDALAAGDGERAFEAMHTVLDEVWAEVARVLRPGGIACVNVGDATRTLERFRVYPNHSRVLDALTGLGLEPLPDVLWRKPANSAAKFMGSGMLPPNAYVTLEHEHILICRNGARRSFPAGADRRYESAFFWEERNRWFSDVWTDVRGRLQDLADDDLRDRAAAYPFAVPYRLLNMYSVYGDTVLDPFWGTGTTTLAAMVAGRSSVGYERDPALVEAFADRIDRVPALSAEVVAERLEAHRAFAADRRAAGDPLEYEADRYDFGVRTAQERRILLREVTGVAATEEGYRVDYRPV
jgi:DNA modification methylase